MNGFRAIKVHREHKAKAERSDLSRAGKQYLWNVREHAFLDHSRLNGTTALSKVYYVYHNYRKAKAKQINARPAIPKKEVTTKQGTSFHDTTAPEVCEKDTKAAGVKENGTAAGLEKDNNHISVVIEKIQEPLSNSRDREVTCLADL